MCRHYCNFFILLFLSFSFSLCLSLSLCPCLLGLLSSLFMLLPYLWLQASSNWMSSTIKRQEICDFKLLFAYTFLKSFSIIIIFKMLSCFGTCDGRPKKNFKSKTEIMFISSVALRSIIIIIIINKLSV